MPDPINVEELANELHSSGVINLDTPARELLRPVGIGIANPADQVADNVLAWSDYVLVTSGKIANTRDLDQVAERVRGLIERPGGGQ